MNSHIKDLVELREAALKKVAHYEEQAKLIQKQIGEIGSEVDTYAKLSDLIGNPTEHISCHSLMCTCQRSRQDIASMVG